jgi:beta-glucosidase
VLFDLGVAQGGWTLFLEDDDGAQKATGPAFQSPGGALRARAVDLGRQENAVALSWAGGRMGRLVLRHPPLDLTRDANAGCCLALHCLVRKRPDGPLAVRLHADGIEAHAVDLDRACGGEPVLIEIPLKAFDDGPRLVGVEGVEFAADAACEMTIARIAISPMTPNGQR